MRVLGPDDIVDPAATIEDNLRGWQPVFERFPGARLDHVAGCVRWLSDVPLLLFNGAIGMPTGDDLETAIATEVDADPEALRDASMIALTTNGLPPTSVDPYVDALDGLADRSTIRTFLARRRGAPLATSTLLAAGVVGLFNVGTLPDARRTGLGRLVSLAAIAAGRDAGYRVAVLQSSRMGEPVYRSIGFEERATFTFAVRVPESPSARYGDRL